MLMHHVKLEALSSKTQAQKLIFTRRFTAIEYSQTISMLRCSSGHQGDVLFMNQKNKHVYGRYKIRGP